MTDGTGFTKTVVDDLDSFPAESVIVQVAVFVPATVNVRVAVESVPCEPSPKSQKNWYGEVPSNGLQAKEIAIPTSVADGVSEA